MSPDGDRARHVRLPAPTRRVTTGLGGATLAILAALAPAGDCAAATSFDSPAHLVVLPAVAEDRPLRLLLDTGDPGGLALDAAAVERLGLTIGPAPAPAGNAHGLLGPLPVPLGTVRIGRLAIDGAHWIGVQALVIHEPPALAAAVGTAYDGVIGTALLIGKRLDIDYRRRTLRFVPGTATPGGGAEPGSSLRLDDGRLVTLIDLGLGPRPAIVDTASAATLVDLQAGGSPQAVPGGVRGLVDAGGTSAGLPSTRLGSLIAGGATLRGVTALTLDLGAGGVDGLLHDTPPVAILGADLLARCRVVLDLPAGRFALEEQGR